jgi:hypothetical protein
MNANMQMGLFDFDGRWAVFSFFQQQLSFLKNRCNAGQKEIYFKGWIVSLLKSAKVAAYMAGWHLISKSARTCSSPSAIAAHLR